MIVISDIHGCYGTLRRLLRKCPDELIVFAGDLIDRGPDSASVVRFAMEQKIPTVLGNHEELMVDYLNKHDGYQDGMWLMNGGDTTLRTFPKQEISPALKWMESLPLFLEYGDLLVSHTGWGLHPMRQAALEHRDWRFPEDGRFRVFGHTPQRHPALIPNGICIDTGAAYGGQNQHYGTMTALQWPQMRVFQQRFDESPL